MGKDVLVVIGVGGMGEAIARRVGAGKAIVLADVAETTLKHVADSMIQDGYAVEPRLVHVASAEEVGSLAQFASSLGPVRQVAHTAGLSPTQASAADVLAVDAAGTAHVIDAFGEVVSDGGAGVFIASMAGTMTGQLPADVEAALRSTPSAELLSLPCFGPEAIPDAGVAYSIAKRANQLRVQAASILWGARGARINSISPGIISTPMGQLELTSEAGAYMRAMIEGSGTKRVGTAADIANAAAFLLGPDASFITGADLLVDGGEVAGVVTGNAKF